MSTALETCQLNCHTLLDQLAGELSWEWDSRFKAALAVFPTDKGDVIGSALQASFGQLWESHSLGTAPGPVQALAQSLRGVSRGQRLYTSSLGEELLLYGAWWPWGSGSPISLRVGSHGPEEHLALVEQSLRQCFGLS